MYCLISPKDLLCNKNKIKTVLPVFFAISQESQLHCKQSLFKKNPYGNKYFQQKYNGPNYIEVFNLIKRSFVIKSKGNS